MYVIVNAENNTIPEGANEIDSQGSALLNLLACLGHDHSNPPLADVLSQYHKLEGQWLIVSPVQWHATHNNAVIAAFGTHLDTSEGELKEYFHRFSEHLIDAGIALYYHDPYTWLLSTNFKSLLKAKPVHLILNKPLMLELAQIDETMHWPKFLTESQMFFASYPHNSLINGVWVWSSASLGGKKNIKICTDQTFFSIAQLCSTNVGLYQPSLSLKEYDLLLINDLSALSVAHREQLERVAPRWYWNNMGYEVSVHWLTRLWRKLIHAY
jgi:hypothetical protein